MIVCFIKTDKLIFFLYLYLAVFFSSVSFGQVKIMPLGDEITNGNVGSYSLQGNRINIGYRGKLFNDLKTAGYKIDFVGTQSNGPPSLPYPGVPLYYDYDNEGHNNWEAAQSALDSTYSHFDMLSHIDNFLVSSEPDIILLHLGTYGLENDQSPQEVADNISSLLDKIYTFNPNTVVVLAQIINRGLQVYNQDSEKMTDDSNINFFNDYKAPSNIRTLTTNYNSVLGDMANKRIMNGDKIILVNMEKAITDYNEDSSVFRFFPHGDMFDSFHPNQKGYNKMANVWFNALNNYFIDKPNLSWPENNSKNILTPITFTWSITSNAVSYTLQISKDQKFSSDSLIYNKVVTDRYAIVKNNFLLSKEYYWRVAAQTSKGQIIYSEVWNFTAQPITISAKVFLQGPYTGSDTMSTILNRYHFIPLTQPYNSDPWDYSGNEKVSQIPSGIVDWVLLELRTGLNSSTTVARRAAFIRSDGNIVDLDGNSPVTFSGITSEGYYLIVKHRNHLSIMSSDTLSCSHSTKYDFTTSLSKAYGKNSMADLGGGRFGMISGDNNNDKTISVSDYNLISTNLDRTGYRQPDNNMDGIISIADYNFVEANLFNYTKIP